MKKLTLIVALASCTFFACTQEQPETAATPEAQPESDTAFILHSGADDYGMKQFTLAFLKAGPSRETNKDSLVKMQTGHLNNLRSLMDNGKLLLAGPLLDGSEIRGICVFDCDTSQTKELMEKDPMVVAGHLSLEVHPWYGSAAVMKIPEIHKTLEQKSFTDIE